MIQTYIKNILADALPSLEWTVDHKTADDETGVVYFEGGSKPGEYDVPYRYPNYMVFISSSDWGFAEFAAMKAIELIHKIGGDIVRVDYTDAAGDILETKVFKIQMIRAEGEANPLGVENGVMDYSANFSANLIELKEEN